MKCVIMIKDAYFCSITPLTSPLSSTTTCWASGRSLITCITNEIIPLLRIEQVSTIKEVVILHSWCQNQ